MDSLPTKMLMCSRTWPSKDVDVFADLAFFVEDAIAKARILRPQELEGVTKRGGRAQDLNFAVSFGKGP